jgi:FkbM family methyltransferase
VAFRRWKLDRGDERLRLDYPLTVSSTVIDLGGFFGDWTDAIHRRYGCNVYVFEPVPEYCARIRKRFFGAPRIRVFEVGLAAREATLDLTLAHDGSSLHRSGGESVAVKLVAIDAFLREQALDHIDLIKINIEGAEYELLEYMVANALVERCENMQIQFHNFVPDAVRRREQLRAQFSRTHELTYDYPFVWENWRRRRDHAGH